jgi:hypothetical protein
MKKIAITGIIGFTAIILGLQFAQSDDDFNEYGKSGSIISRTGDVAPVNNALYREECASCHMAYPPGLLPARSWNKLMTSLGNHFGENAEVAPDTRTEISRYLMENSADNSQYRRSRKIIRSLAPDKTPASISELPYIQRKHREIPAKMIKENNGVKSLGNCIACHGQAEQGSFSEREILIPNYGRWDD